MYVPDKTNQTNGRFYISKSTKNQSISYSLRPKQSLVIVVYPWRDDYTASSITNRYFATYCTLFDDYSFYIEETTLSISIIHR